jgi:ankyrin repeat protein
MEDLGELLMQNIRENNIDEIMKILELGIDINDKMNAKETTFEDEINMKNPLVHSIECGNYEITKLLIDMGADVNINFGYGLMTACRQGNNDIIRLLVEEGIQFDKEHFNPSDLIGQCICHDDVDSLILLINHGIVEIIPHDDLYIERIYDYATIWNACMELRTKNILEFIIDNYPDVIPNNINKSLVNRKDKKKYNFIKMLINRNFIDIPD